jgi:hypothetical protein
MKALKIQIIKANLPTYWYAGHIGESFWAEPIPEGYDAYLLINEGAEKGGRFVNRDDCTILKECEVFLETVNTTKVVER